MDSRGKYGVSSLPRGYHGDSTFCTRSIVSVRYSLYPMAVPIVCVHAIMRMLKSLTRMSHNSMSIALYMRRSG